MKDQKGWALVTGASSGIGKSFAKQLAEKGFPLLLVALEKDKLQEVSEQCTKTYGVRTIPMALDLADPESIGTIQREIESQNLDVEFLVNAAGFGYFGDFGKMPPQLISSMIQVNVTTVIQLCRYLLPCMQRRGKGVIINIASVAGFLPYPFAGVYCGGKGLIHFFTKTLWAENRVKGLKIISLCPGYTKSNFAKVSQEPDGIHLFSPENSDETARKTLSRLSQRGCTLFSRTAHPYKIFAAKLLPLKVFTGILRYLSKTDL